MTENILLDCDFVVVTLVTQRYRPFSHKRIHLKLSSEYQLPPPNNGLGHLIQIKGHLESFKSGPKGGLSSWGRWRRAGISGYHRSPVDPYVQVNLRPISLAISSQTATQRST